ncbi:shikimate dehydrogenase [Gephyromycinifex aptenodytis]|uniref:shikimate dehydrogenase n=1 Tax=Gephyromycinifex aptenodytis TaxID=2716227 RepID=UPI001448136F|nr:shikimate dehydrogenase [Gephyromycinifex aptenodytis]
MLRHRAAVLGSPIAHSLSPVLHEAAYAALGLSDWSYAKVAVGGPGEPNLAGFLHGLDREWIGLSVTMPLKEEALQVASVATAQAQRLGAANTLIRSQDGWIAEATDPDGIEQALLHAGLRSARSALVFGSGATARAALESLARFGVTSVGLGVRDQVRPQTSALARQLGQSLTSIPLAQLESSARLEQAIGEVEVVVSTLPAGAFTPPGAPSEPRDDSDGWNDAGDVTEPQPLAGTYLLDVVYADWPTPLARWANRRGAQVVSGLEMLLYQAAEQVALMTGRTAPVPAMRAALEASLAESV